jgi:hypothetical protein
MTSLAQFFRYLQAHNVTGPLRESIIDYFDYQYHNPLAEIEKVSSDLSVIAPVTMGQPSCHPAAKVLGRIQERSVGQSVT